MGSDGKKDGQKRPAGSGWGFLRDLSILALFLGGSIYLAMILMPGRSFKGSVPPLTEKELKVRAVLEGHVRRRR